MSQSAVTTVGLRRPAVITVIAILQFIGNRVFAHWRLRKQEIETGLYVSGSPRRNASTNVLTFIVIGSILTVTVTFAEANISGRWNVMMDPDFKGNPSTEHCQMRQQNRKLTVTCGAGGEAMVGEVNGHKVFWKFTSSGGAIAAWSGQLDKAGVKIEGTWLFTYPDGGKMKGNFTAQKRPN